MSNMNGNRMSLMKSLAKELGYSISITEGKNNKTNKFFSGIIDNSIIYSEEERDEQKLTYKNF